DLVAIGDPVSIRIEVAPPLPGSAPGDARHFGIDVSESRHRSGHRQAERASTWPVPQLVRSAAPPHSAAYRCPSKAWLAAKGHSRHPRPQHIMLPPPEPARRAALSNDAYTSPEVWTHDPENGGQFAGVNRPTAGPREE